MRTLSQQVVVVTGASSGTGHETAIQLGWCGAHVVLAARNEEARQNAVAEVEEAGGKARYVVADVSDWKQVDRPAFQAVEHFSRIGTWTNNAGISVYTDISQSTPDEMKHVIGVNLVSEILGTKAAFARMHGQGGEGLINSAQLRGI